MEPIVDIRPGRLRGRRAGGVHVFLGVPYAAPPFGPHRLRPPQPVAAWSGVRDALVWGAKPPQPPYPPPWDVLIPERDVPGEDCLTLNVWSPQLGAAGLPVLVWITGGAFEHGTAAVPAYDGSRFARDGVVLVSINYRVGAEGFAYLDGGTANLGLCDQIAALEWVRDNIAAFGGDPGRVTVFGESAGALSIGALLSMPSAEGLFRRAIVQSGGAHYALPVPTAQRVARVLADRLGIAATRDALAAVPVDRLLAAQGQVAADLAAHPDPEQWGREVVASQLPWQPVLGPDLPARPIDRITAGAGATVDLLAGSNLDEWNFFLVPAGAIDQITPEMLAGTIAARGLPVEETLAGYRAAHPDAGPGELFAKLQGDWYLRIPTLHLADAHAGGPAATYTYEFAWRSPQYDGRLGACHGLEIGFVFDTVPGFDTEVMTGPAPPRQLAEAMHAAWVAFATTGDPGWPGYDLTRRATMRFDTTSDVVDDPQAAVRGLWDGLR